MLGAAAGVARRPVSDIVCKEDNDCPLSLICIEVPSGGSGNGDVPGGYSYGTRTEHSTSGLGEKDASESGDNAGLCACSGWYGWTDVDSNCTMLGPQGYSSLAVDSFLVIVVCLALAVGLAMLWHTISKTRKVMAKHRARSKFFRIRQKLNSTAISNVYSCLALLFMLLWRVQCIIIVMTPQWNDHYISSDIVVGSEKTHRLVESDRVLMGLVCFFGVLTAMHIGISWASVARDSAKRLGQTHDSKGLAAYTAVNYVFQSLFLIILTVCLATNQVGLLAVASVPFIIFIIGTCLLGQAKIKRMIADLLSRHHPIASRVQKAQSSRSNLGLSKMSSKCHDKRTLTGGHYSGQPGLAGAAVSGSEVTALALNDRDVAGFFSDHVVPRRRLCNRIYWALLCCFDTPFKEVRSRFESQGSSKSNVLNDGRHNSTLQYIRIATSIQRTSRLICFFLACMVAFAISFSYMMYDGWRKYDRPDRICIPAVMCYLVAVCIVAALISVQVYFYEGLVGPLGQFKMPCKRDRDRKNNLNDGTPEAPRALLLV